VVSLEHGLRQGDRHARLRRRGAGGANLEAHTIPVRGVHDGLELGTASVEDTDSIADRESKHARQVLGFIDWEENPIAGGTCRRREEPRNRHAAAL
jgi:hypothetical protein